MTSYFWTLRCFVIARLLFSCSVMSDSLRPHGPQHTRLPHPWDSPDKNTGVDCHFLLQCMKVKSESEVAQSCPTLVTPRTAAYQATPSVGFSRQEYWSGVPLMSIESVMPSNHLILCHPLLLLPSIFHSIRVFSNWLALCIRWPKYWSFQLQHRSFQ